MTDDNKMRFETLALHAGQVPNREPGALVTPIYQTSTYFLQDPTLHGEDGEYFYSRFANPTVVALEKVAAALEQGQHGLAFGSGMAATTAAMLLLRPTDHVLTTLDLYGGTSRLVRDVLGRYEIAFDFVDKGDPAQVEAAMRPNTRLVWVDTISTPLLSVTDIDQMAQIAHQHNALLGVDNTLTTPYFQNPLLQSADLVMHSCTKYLGGHHDLFAGLLVMNDDLHQQILDTRTMTGGILGPFDAWLVLRGIKTLGARMEIITRNALAIARNLEVHPRVGRVLYPGLESHPQHALAVRQMRGFGGLVTIGVKGGREAAVRMVNALSVVTSAVSFGGVESVAELPPMPPRQQIDQAGIDAGLGLVRLSIGLEHADDLIADLEHALTAV